MTEQRSGKPLESSLQAVLFDMDGVITDTASAHAAAWKALFDEYLRSRAAARGEDFRPFDADRDYRELVDGKPRYDGVRSFLASRGIDLAFGSESDEPERETICGLGNRKNRYFNAWIADNRVEPFPGTIALIEALRSHGVKTAVFSSSRNAEAVLQSASVLELFEVKVDGVDMAALGLPGKPDPAILERAAALLGVPRECAAVVEDAISGVRAGARGGFAPVIGVARHGHDDDLRRAGAHLVVEDLGEIGFDPARGLFIRKVDELPSLWQREEELRGSMAGKRVVAFLDHDGTLSPIVENPSEAIVPKGMKEAVAALAERCPVAVISGRDLDDVRRRVGLDALYYAGSHGFEMAGPHGWRVIVERGKDFLPELDRAEAALKQALCEIPGAAVERKSFSIAVHYRRVKPSEVEAVEQAVGEVMGTLAKLRASPGKKVFDIKPATDWHKGRAVQALLERLELGRRDDILPLYVGDDVTDEDAFRALSGHGIGIVVRDGERRPTSARYALNGPGDVERFLRWLVAEGGGMKT